MSSQPAGEADGNLLAEAKRSRDGDKVILTYVRETQRCEEGNREIDQESRGRQESRKT